MTIPTKTVFDFPLEQWPSLELQNSDGGWNTHREWTKWFFGYVVECEARLAKREPRTSFGKTTASALGGFAANIPGDVLVGYVITEIVPGADPEPDWETECERLTKRVNELADVQQQDLRLIAQRDNQIAALEKTRDAYLDRIGELEIEKTNLLESYHKMRMEKEARVRELEGALAASAAAVQKLEERNKTLQERSEYLEETLKAGARAAEVTF